jgi:hypothetical protein
MSTEEKHILDKQILDPANVEEKYVAFVDILGFSNNVLRSFDALLDTYDNVLRGLQLLKDIRPEVKLSIYSDSFLLVSSKLGPLIGATQALHMQTLFWDCLVRGGIAYGKHFESSSPPHLFMISEAVVKAVAIEKAIRYPCVALHPDIEVPDEWWGGYECNLERGLLYFGGHRIINPMNIAWGQSAGTRVSQLLNQHPEHRDKYEWFLELHKAVFCSVPMVPPRYFVNKI